MPVFYCQHCGQPIDADVSLAGMEVGCPGCRGVVQVPGAAPASAPSQEYQPYQPPAIPQGQSFHQGQQSSLTDKGRLWFPIIGTGVTFFFCLMKKFIEPVSSLDVALGNTGLPAVLGGAIGYTLAVCIFAVVTALVIAGIAAACKKSFTSVLARSYGIGAVLFALLMMAGAMLLQRLGSASRPVVQSSQSNERAREELNKLEDDMKKMQAGAIPPTADAPPSATPTPAPDDASDMEKLVLISRQYFEEMAALQKEYTEELDKTGFTRLLDTARVQADTDFSETETILARVRVLVRKQGDKMRAALSSLPEKIRASTISLAEKESGAVGAEKGIPPALATFNETWKLEESVVDQMANIMELLRKRRGHWQVSNGKFLFNDDNDLKTFNTAMAEIQLAATRQTEIQQQNQQKSGKVFDDMRTAIPK
ncbi:hypothetical protein [Prosthecobacter sp.]|uniref:hypothetical protein n=1 Tax=Prosthecobacter sp. TaxID=1965333 RepID=UPI00378313A7